MSHILDHSIMMFIMHTYIGSSRRAYREHAGPEGETTILPERSLDGILSLPFHLNGSVVLVLVH